MMDPQELFEVQIHIIDLKIFHLARKISIVRSAIIRVLNVADCMFYFTRAAVTELPLLKKRKQQILRTHKTNES